MNASQLFELASNELPERIRSSFSFKLFQSFEQNIVQMRQNGMIQCWEQVMQNVIAKVSNS